jgi:hypothetical protein
MPLDTDVMGADSQLLVKFYEKEYGPDKGKDFIRIDIPGNQTLQIDTEASRNNGAYKKRFPHHWLRYQMEKNGDPVMSGVKLEDWMKEMPADLNPDQLAELQHFRFQTVEQLAMASDLAIQRIGMGGEGLRAKAQFFLKGKNKSATDSELAATKNELEELKKQVALLIGAQANRPVAPEPKRRGAPKGGWPKKDKVLADGQQSPAISHAGNE